MIGTSPHGSIRKGLGEPASSSTKRSLPDIDSRLAFTLICRWCWGLLSAPDVQRYASDAVQDQEHLLSSLRISKDNVSKSLKRLAGLGSGGKYEQNIKNELLRYIGEPLLKFVKFIVPLVRDKSGDEAAPPTKEIDFPIMLPHEVFSFLYHECPEIFANMFLGGEDRSYLASFWRELVDRADPRLHNHPMRAIDDWEYNNVPLKTHGDAVPCLAVGKANTKSFDVYSMIGVLSKGTMLLRKIVLFGLFEKSKNDGNKGETMRLIWKRLLWSCHFLALGLNPTHDDNGVEYVPGTPEYERSQANGGLLAGGMRAIIFLLASDNEHFSKSLGLPASTSNTPCFWCPANRSIEDVPMRYNNFRRDARWKMMIYSALAWRHLGMAKHWVFELIYLSCLNVEPDELHVTWLGTAADMLGNCLWTL